MVTKYESLLPNCNIRLRFFTESKKFCGGNFQNAGNFYKKFYGKWSQHTRRLNGGKVLAAYAGCFGKFGLRKPFFASVVGNQKAHLTHFLVNLGITVILQNDHSSIKVSFP